MGQSLLTELLSKPAELTVMLGSLIFFVASIAFILSGRVCQGCGRICIETGHATQFQQIMGKWICNRYRIELCGNLECSEPLHVRTKTRRATKAEVAMMELEAG
jgi:hypothetical protein